MAYRWGWSDHHFLTRMILHVWGGLGLTNSSPWSWMDFLQRTACDLGSNYGMLQGSVENFLRIFFSNFLASKIISILLVRLMFCSSKFGVVSPDKCGVHRWRMMMTKNPQTTWWIVRQTCPKSDQTIFKLMNFCFGESDFFSAFFFNTYTHHTVDGRNPAPVAKQFITLFTGFFYIPDGAGFLSSTVPSPSFSVEPRNFSRGFSCLNHFSSPFCRCGSLVRKTKFHDLFFWRWHPRMSCSQHVFHFLWIQTYSDKFQIIFNDYAFLQH